MAKRRSKWRRTWQVVKKMMQEARKVKAYESIKQCPVCGNPHSLSISIKHDKLSDRKSAEVICSACKFEYKFDEIPPIADEFWIYSKILDIARGEAIEEKKIEITSSEITADEPSTIQNSEQVEKKASEEEIDVDVEVVYNDDEESNQ